MSTENNNNTASASASAPAAAAVNVRQLEDEIKKLRVTLADKEREFTEASPSSSGGGGGSKKSKKKAGMIEKDPVQGCRDFPPEEMRVRNYLFNTFHKSAKAFGFEEYDAPVLESEELYIRKAGEEITEQMYNFVTKSGHKVALRPEMTPTLARLLLGKGKALMLPAKWYSIPQCWRFEAIQRGRRREHYQWNMDIVGVKGVSAEAELIAALCGSFESFGLTYEDIGIKVNSRKILQHVVEGAGVKPEKFAEVCVIVDKLEKLPREEIERQLHECELEASAVATIIKTLSAKTLEEVVDAAGGAESEGMTDLRTFFTLIDSYGLSKWVKFDASVVRGLAYYTGIVFEAFDRAGKFRAICGGGRYDKLLETFGSSQQIPCAGFGFGDCVILELLQDKKLLPVMTHTVDYVVIPFDESVRPEAVKILASLRRQGYTADVIMDKKKIAQSFSYADRVGAKKTIFLAPDELKEGKVKVKDMLETDETKKEKVVDITEFLK